VLLFEMLTGRLPFDVADAAILHIIQAAAPAPSSLNEAVPRELDPIVAKALAKSLDQRCDSAATLAAELRSVAAILDERATAAELHASPATARRPRKRFPWIVLLVVVAALVATWLFLRH
jgi:serine/threonine protein kinase